MNEIQKIIDDAQRTPEYWSELARVDFAVLLNEEMEKQGVNERQLAKTLKVPKAHIIDVLSGEAPDLTLGEMSRFLFVFGKRLCLSSGPVVIERVKTLEEMCPAPGMEAEA